MIIVRVRTAFLLFAGVVTSLLSVRSVFPQRILNPPYPRKATLQWGGGTVDWLKRFDLVIMGKQDTNICKSLRPAAPETYIFQTTDWEQGGLWRTRYPGGTGVPWQWHLRDVNGVAYPYDSGDSLMDLTNYCPLVNGERFNQALARRLVDEVDTSVYDGVYNDGFMSFPWDASGRGNPDLDRDGINDYTEGHDNNWIRNAWQAGWDSLFQNIRNRWKTKGWNQRLIGYETASTDSVGLARNDAAAQDYVNGAGWEKFFKWYPGSALSFKTLYDKWGGDTVHLPRINFINAHATSYDAGHAPPEPKNYYRFMRWCLGICLLGDGYFNMEGGDEHFWSFYYDEYDTRLGYPTGPAQRLANGCWARFFDHGVSIVNMTNATQTVADADLSSLSGYAGPYYRFQGNQDTAWNNGKQFTSITMTATQATLRNDPYVGDGIILLKKPSTIVADIIVDNTSTGTSPGSPAAITSGFAPDYGATMANLDWNTGGHWASAQVRSQYAPAGNGSATAVFKPTINVAGQYRVYEWHGWRGQYPTSYTMATNVPCTIAYANGTAKATIDQSRNFGRWNLLGTFAFSPGSPDSVTITNNANGSVLADAFMFRYVSNDSSTFQGEIDGSVFMDQNLNRQYDAGEPKLPGWRIVITGPVTDSTITDSAGYYSFKNLPAGTYTATERISPPWQQTYPFPLPWYSISLGNDSTLGTADFGDYSAATVSEVLQRGWNIISLPMEVPNRRASAVFPSAISEAFEYFGVYIPVDTLLPGRGYWMKFPQDLTLYTAGVPVMSDTIDVDAGWNLIGSISVPLLAQAVQTVPPGMMESPFYGVDHGTTIVDTLYPGHGYWIKTGQAGSVILSSGSAAEGLNRFLREETAVLDRIEIVSASGDAQTLYLETGSHPDLDSLLSSPPPSPPSGIFDARFYPPGRRGNGGLIASFAGPNRQNVEWPIVISSPAYPLEIRWTVKDPARGYSLNLPDGVESRLSGSGKLSMQKPDGLLQGETCTLKLSASDGNQDLRPSSFELRQNYPNPFNNSTMIRFAIPADGQVQLVVYDVLGQSVATLLDQFVKSGRYSIPFDASRLASGVYYYHLTLTPVQGNSMTGAKSMLLVK